MTDATKKISLLDAIIERYINDERKVYTITSFKRL